MAAPAPPAERADVSDHDRPQTSLAGSVPGVMESDVAEAKRTVVRLEAEKSGLIDAFMQHLDVASPAKLVIELLKPAHAELKQQLDSVNTQLVEASKRLTLAVEAQTQQQTIQAIKRDHAAANLGPSGFSPERQRSRGNVSPRAVPQLQAPGQGLERMQMLSTSDSESKRWNESNFTKTCMDLLKADMSADYLKNGKQKLLQRACYETTLDWIAKKAPHDEEGEDEEGQGAPCRLKAFPVGGTPGVGKSTFRLWVLARWLHAKKSSNPADIDEWLAKFEAVSYYVTATCLVEVRLCDGRVQVDSVATWPHCCALVVLEWTQLVSEQLDNMALFHPGSVAILTGSPGRFVRGSQLLKEQYAAPATYLPTWSTEELEQVFEFTADSFHTRGGVARLWTMDDEHVHRHVAAALMAAGDSDLARMLSGGLQETSCVHRILDIGISSTTEGFISKAVTDKAMAQVMKAAQSDISGYVSRVVHVGGVFAKTYLGHLFEAFFSSDFGKGATSLMYNESEIKLNGADCVAFADGMQCQDKVLYKPEKRNFHGIDCFVMQGNTAIMLQVTVGKTHTPVSEEHPDIKKLMGTFRGKAVVLVYVVPSKDHVELFTAPKNNPDSWTVYVGHPAAKKFEVYSQLRDVPLPSDNLLTCQYCGTSVTRQKTRFASEGGLKTHEHWCRKQQDTQNAHNG